ncbi:MAG: arginine--tRNA ligase [Mycobacteriales bacterium]
MEAGEIDATVPAEVRIERPRHRSHGDYASSVALQLAKTAGSPPREVADRLAVRLRQVPGLAAVEVAGPGFLNVTLASGSLGEVCRQVVTAGASYGRSAALQGQRVNVEFVSANPTGPIHIGGVRWAAVGDALARLLAAAGAEVEREYYVNDAGAQVDHFAASLYAAARGEPIPDDGYLGDYIAGYASQILATEPTALDLPETQALAVFRREGLALVLTEIQSALERFGVHFDTFFSESSLNASGALDAALLRLREQGHVYDADGATWLATTRFGDDKDRPLVKGDGSPTYFLSDAAYYLDKRKRGFDKVLILLGADHHGYLGRMRAVARCLGDDPDVTLEMPIGQLVSVVQGGQVLRQSKRHGTYLPLDDLVDMVGVDAARYTLVRVTVDSQLEIDVDVVTRQVAENPVFYVQYAATRAASILRNATELGIPVLPPDQVEAGLLSQPQETDLLAALAEFPAVVSTAAELRAPHRVARYLEEQVGRSAQRFFDECRVLPRGDEPVTELTHARLLLWRATRVVLENGLALLGVTAPVRM